jgi:hypothetical protein
MLTYPVLHVLVDVLEVVLAADAMLYFRLH